MVSEVFTDVSKHGAVAKVFEVSIVITQSLPRVLRTVLSTKHSQGILSRPCLVPLKGIPEIWERFLHPDRLPLMLVNVSYKARITLDEVLMIYCS